MVSRGGISSRDDSAGADGAAWARGVRAVAVLTGAGISTDSGIPDLDARGRPESIYNILRRTARPRTVHIHSRWD
jgi:NAD-dependent SIR2 family protein deacetylase